MSPVCREGAVPPGARPEYPHAHLAYQDTAYSEKWGNALVNDLTESDWVAGMDAQGLSTLSRYRIPSRWLSM
jgi:hypothetical protein